MTCEWLASSTVLKISFQKLYKHTYASSDLTEIVRVCSFSSSPRMITSADVHCVNFPVICTVTILQSFMQPDKPSSFFFFLFFPFFCICSSVVLCFLSDLPNSHSKDFFSGAWFYFSPSRSILFRGHWLLGDDLVRFLYFFMSLFLCCNSILFLKSWKAKTVYCASFPFLQNHTRTDTNSLLMPACHPCGSILMFTCFLSKVFSHIRMWRSFLSSHSHFLF